MPYMAGGRINGTIGGGGPPTPPTMAGDMPGGGGEKGPPPIGWKGGGGAKMGPPGGGTDCRIMVDRPTTVLVDPVAVQPHGGTNRE